MTGALITFEGGEGCGKTTQVALLASALRQIGQDVLCLREPGGTAIGEAIRDLLKHHPAAPGLCPEAEILLFCASRAQLVRERIRPALTRGTWVLCDRFFDSTTVYQGRLHHLPAPALQILTEFAVGDTLPALTFFLDLPPEVASARSQNAPSLSRDSDHRDLAPIEFHQKVRQEYLALAAAHPRRIRTIDASSDPQTVHHRILEEIHRAFPDLLA